MFLRAIRLALGLEHPTRRELAATQDQLDALDARVDAHYAELKTLRGRVHAIHRWEKPPEVPAESTNGESTAPEPTPVKSTATEHLSRRFKVF